MPAKEAVLAFGENLFWAAVAQGKCEEESLSWFPCEPFLRQNRGSSSVPWALSWCPVPAFISLFTCLWNLLNRTQFYSALSPEPLAEPMGNDAEERKGRRKEGTEDKGWADGFQECF